MKNDEIRSDERLLTAQEVADELQVSVRTVRSWAHRGGGPKRIHIGRHVRYKRSDLDAWIDSRYVD